MKHYEMLYLVSGAVPETEVAGIQSEIADWIAKAGAKLTKQEPGGRRKLAYAIKNEKYGYYTVVEFDAEQDSLLGLKKQLTLAKTIMRFLLIDKKPMSAKEMLLQEQAQKRAQARMTQQDTRAGKGDKPSIGSPKHDQTSKKDSKISLEDLDKKLDELLDTDIIS
ncbi:MAG: 30S ribosomal protein S6 [Candidatus Komeilibacteria bacterium]|nr:30S ribosomal protein S6 [Candidatus Komeilibacteria bacterium]